MVSDRNVDIAVCLALLLMLSLLAPVAIGPSGHFQSSRFRLYLSVTLHQSYSQSLCSTRDIDNVSSAFHGLRHVALAASSIKCVTQAIQAILCSSKL